MIQYAEMKKYIEEIERKEFEEEQNRLISINPKIFHKTKFPGINTWSIGQIMNRYNNENNLDKENSYIWYSLGECFSLLDLRQEMKEKIKEYTDDLFNQAVKVTGAEDFDLPSAYFVIVDYIRNN